MIIHYQNSRGEERLLRNIVAIQNINNDELEALTESGKTLRIHIAGIEMILDNEIVKERRGAE